MSKFINESDLEFNAIHEEERTYTFPNGKTYTIPHPEVLHVSASGGHRIYNGIHCFYVQPREGWVIKWTPKADSATFSK